MRVSRNESLRKKVDNREQKEVDHFKYLGSVLTRDCYCTREIKARNFMRKEAFYRKISLLTGKLNIELRKKFIRRYVWSIALYGSETSKLRKLEWKFSRSSKYDTGGEPQLGVGLMKTSTSYRLKWVPLPLN